MNTDSAGYGGRVIPDRYDLAGSSVSVPPLGVGTWAWGDRSTWGMGGYDSDLTDQASEEAWDASIGASVTFFDTAEVYGGGRSERIIGTLLRSDPTRSATVQIATKFMPSPWKLNVRVALLASLRSSLDRLGLPAVDLYQIHGPISLRSHGALAEALAAAHQEGLVKAVGVSNYSAKETRSIAGALSGRGPVGPGPGARYQSDRILASATRSGGRGAPGHLRRTGRAAPGLLPHRTGQAHRQVQRRQPATGQAELLQPSDGGRRQGRGGAAIHRQGPRGQAAEPGGARSLQNRIWQHG
jgi:hypothetical protein